MVNLNRQGGLMAFLLNNTFLPSRTRLNAVTTGVADTVDGSVVHDNRLVVNIRDVCYVHVGHAAVVIEVAPTPLATVETFPGVAEAVINAAIESDMRTPISHVKEVEPFVPFPPSRSPEHAHGSEHPGARHPIVALVIVPSPIARRPQIARPGTEGLRIYREGWRGYAHRKEHTDLTERNSGKDNGEDCQQQPVK
jgi:hypothetical protein